MVFLDVLLFLFFVICSQRLVSKAGKPGWASIIPIYDAIVLLDTAHQPLCWVLLYFVPLVNIIVAVIVMVELAKRFGQGTGFAVGLLLLRVTFYPVLAFGGATYTPYLPTVEALAASRRRGSHRLGGPPTSRGRTPDPVRPGGRVGTAGAESAEDEPGSSATLLPPPAS